MVFSPKRNKTILGIAYAENRLEILTTSIAVSNVIVPFGAFAIVIVCTAILIINLHRKPIWRKSAAATNSENLSSRDHFDLDYFANKKIIKLQINPEDQYT